MAVDLLTKEENKSERVKEFFSRLSQTQNFSSFVEALSVMTDIMDQVEKEAYEASNRQTNPMRVPKYESWNYNANFSWIRSAYTTKQVIFISHKGAVAIYRLIVNSEGVPITDPFYYKGIDDPRNFIKPNIFGKNVWDR